jgi:hypothetical protein
MLKMKNRWLQWLQNVQKTLDGIFLHLVWPKPELESLPGSFAQFFDVSSHENALACEQTSSRAHFHAKTQHPHASHKLWHSVE